jgi:hypothetical protein
VTRDETAPVFGPCETCNGTGRGACRECYGSGGGEREPLVCVNCDGSGTGECGDCYGSGLEKVVPVAKTDEEEVTL